MRMRWFRRSVATVSALTVPAAAGMNLGQLLTRLREQVRDDHTRAHAGHLAFRGLFSIFATLIVTFALLAVFEARDLVGTLVDRLSPAFPRPVVDAVRKDVLDPTMKSTKGAIGFGTAASVAAALYGLSAAARAVIDAMNTIYEVEEGRPFWSRYITSLVMALAIIGLLIGALLLVAVGPQVGSALASAIGLQDSFELVLQILRWPVLVALVLLAHALIYTHAPAATMPFRFITHGSITATAGWLLFSLAFSVYLENFGSFNATYGTVAGVAILLLYMYFASLIMLIGGEINDIIARHSSNHAPRGEENKTADSSAVGRAAPDLLRKRETG